MHDGSTQSLTGCTAVILAGGHGSRIGGSKADILWHGVPLIEHVTRRLREVCGSVIAVIRRGQSAGRWSVDDLVYDDSALPESPLRGLVAGLEACTGEIACVASCDVPMLQPRLYQALHARMMECDLAAVPQWQDQLHVLQAVYRPQAAIFFHALLQNNVRSVRQALHCVSHTVLNEQQCREAGCDGFSFHNVNTWHDYRRLPGCGEPAVPAVVHVSY